MRPLVIPPAAQRDDDAVQMLSAWIAENGLHCTLNIGMWKAHGHDETRSWGILLADVVRHIANALQDESGVSADTTVEQISAGIWDELGFPTSSATGRFSPGNS